MPTYCSVDGCSSTSEKIDISFFRCPKDQKRSENWKRSLGFIGNHRYADLTPEQCHSRIRICRIHFSAESFSDIPKTRLTTNAVPSLLLPAETDKYTQTPDKLSSNSPRKKALRHKIATMEKSIASTSRQSLETKITLEDVTKFLTENYSGKSCDLLKAQLFLLDKAPKGSRYSDDFKQFALRCYVLGPKAYKKLSAIYRLPSKSTLERYTKNWMVKPGFNDFIFQCIQFRAIYLKEKEKDCILCIDEISLKSNLYYDISNDKIVGFQEGLTETSIIASSALTVMVRGLASNWRLPLAFFFYRTSANADDLKQILLTTVQKCKSIGLNVLGVVSDQGSNFQKLVKTLNVTQENPFFVVDNARIVYLFDIPHLLKSIRNNFFSYTFVLSNQEIRKQYLETFYSHDKTKQHRLAPKLTDDHIYPNNFQKMKVKLACQVLVTL
ncbi:unnamed protein product [Callosobruchus maculatus]|uniref:THAP-type domain-containing protein n=1 Tax=Callosobruchus maculatus TaxID=64391 RepID=A0A653CDB2_CALMS|nr:unnamed protein product [Callosobruchus maculatus]